MAVITNYPIGLYIHIPFCIRKCPYCDFYSVPLVAGEVDVDRVAAALAREVGLIAGRFGWLSVGTVFLGGGTPSLLPPESIAMILDAARGAFDVRQDAEITMEANPGTVTLERLRGYASAGVNRLSIGAQSTDDRLLREIGRVHNADAVYAAAECARTAGIRNLSFDVLYGLPGQTLGDVAATIQSLLRFKPEHMSCYELTLEPHTPMAREHPSLPDEDAVIGMSTAIGRELRSAGLYRYEISNYAKPGFACRHNLIYWKRGQYVGIGPAAHSYYGGARFANERDIGRWLERIEHGTLEWEQYDDIGQDEARFESMMLGLRLIDGVDIQAFVDECRDSPFDIWPVEMNDMRKLGWINWNACRVWLTPSGLMMHNAVCVRLMK